MRVWASDKGQCHNSQLLPLTGGTFHFSDGVTIYLFVDVDARDSGPHSLLRLGVGLISALEVESFNSRLGKNEKK